MKPEREPYPQFTFTLAPPSTDKVFHFEDAFIGRSDPLFYIRDVTLHRGERIGILGENGVGKSTFLKTILGRIPLLE